MNKITRNKITVPGDKDNKEVLKESSKQKHKGH